MVSQEFIKDIYKSDVERRERLAVLVDSILPRLCELDMKLEAQDAEQLKHTVTGETFKILIIGEFNTGKSTFINALLGEDVLPTKAIPATAIINQLRYGEQPAAWLHFRDPEKTPLEIPIDKLNEHVLIKNNEHEEAARNEIRESPFSHAEILWPLDLCRDNNVEIIDSPGLNESKVRENITLDYLRKVDAVLFIMAAVRFGPAQTEKDTITMLKAAGHEELFFVINQWDLLRLAKHQEEVRGTAMKVLPTLTQRKNDIYFVSALDALESRMNNDPEMEKRSGFQPLETSLHKFLADERGRIKAVRGARELRLLIRKLEEDSIPKKLNLLRTPLGELQEKYAAAKKDLDRLQADKMDMLNFVSRERTQITNLTRSRVKEFFYSIDNHVDEWSKDYQIRLKFNFNVKEQVNDAVTGFSEHLTEKLSNSFKDWEKDVLTPFIEDRLQSLYRELEIRAIDFENHLNAAHFTLNGTTFKEVNLNDEFGPKNALERLLAAAGGWFVGGIGAGAIGAIFGYREMLKSLIPNVAAIIAAIVIGLPVLPVMLIVGAIMGVSTVSNMGNRIKEKVGERFRQEIREKSGEQAEQIANQLDEQLGALKNALEAGMERRIAEVKEQAETALAAHEKGESEVNLKFENIDSIKKELNQINDELDEFIVGLVNPKGD